MIFPGSVRLMNNISPWIEERLIKDLQKRFPDAKLAQEQSAVDALTDIYTDDCSIRFIFVLDEWDFIFHQPFITENEKWHICHS